MTSKKLYFILIGVLVVVGLATLGVGYGANALLTGQSKKLADTKAVNQAVSDQQEQLLKNKEDIKNFSELNKTAQAIVPQDKDQAEAVRQIVKLAAESGIPQLSSITFPASTLGISGSAAKGVPGASTSSNGITQVTPVAGITGVYDLQITVVQDPTRRVPYSRFTTFLSKLEQNRRTAQVTSINIQPDPAQPDQVAFTLVIDEFIKP